MADLTAHGSQHGLCRGVSLALAAPLGLLLLIHPGSIVAANGRYSHGLLMLIMWGICAGFVHGVGFRSHLRWFKPLISPWVAWPLLIGGYVLLVKVQGGW